MAGVKAFVLILVYICHWRCYVLGTTVPGTSGGSSAMLEKKSYKTAFCLTHIETNEMYLHCGHHGLVNLLGAYHGVQDIPMDDNPVCSYQESGACLKPIADIGSLRSRCMGTSECRFPVGILYLEDCDQDSNFVQAEYECIPGNNVDFGNVIDICGDILEGKVITRDQGYIVSLDYPAAYPPDEMCSCNITAKSTDAEVVFETIDVDTFSPLYYERGNDWLEYTTVGQQWGSGHIIEKTLSKELIRTKSNSVHLNFRSDSINEARGFWLKYFATLPSGAPSPMDVTCGKYFPKGYRSSIVCFEKEPKQEVYLNCHYMGVINILYAEHGYHSTLGKCAPVNQRKCTRNALGHYGMLEQCMGMKECRIVVPKETIPNCSHDSNYFQVEYQCIPDQRDPFNIIDLCGDQQQGRPITKEVGYIESLNYPEMYPPDSQCECKLQVHEPETEIILTVIDIRLGEAKHVPQCTHDWIEYVPNEQNRGKGKRICEHPTREPIHTDTNLVFLNFETDSDYESRGVWLKYYGRKANGGRVPVTVTCKDLKPYIRYSPIEEAINTEQNTSNGKTTSPHVVLDDPDVSVVEVDNQSIEYEDEVTFGLMVGLGVVAVLIFAVLIGMIVYKYKRKLPKGICSKKDDPTVTVSTQRTVHLDTGYGSTYTSTYNNIEDESTRSSSTGQGSILAKNFGSTGIQNPGYEHYIPEPDYNIDDSPESSMQQHPKRPPLAAGGKYKIAYKNPVFDDHGDGLIRSDYVYRT